MDKIWVFLGGVAVGVAGLVTTALVWDSLETGDGSSEDAEDDGPVKLALPEGSNTPK